MPSPRPPTDEEIASATGYLVNSRQPHRSTALSVVERVAVNRPGQPPRPAFVKTTRPAMAHEIRVYPLLDGLAIRAATLLGSGRTRAGNPWLLLSEVEGTPVTDGDHGAVKWALARAAVAHSRHLDTVDAGLPDRNPRWLAAQADWTCDALRRHCADSPLTTDLLDTYQQRLDEISAQTPSATTLVHGDFDPGNLIRLNDSSAAALDWGLSHLNTPLVDLAHMVERYEDPLRSRLAEHYLKHLDFDLGLTERSAVALGGLVHHAFFIWWHITVVENGWAPAIELRDVMAQRVHQVAAAELN